MDKLPQHVLNAAARVITGSRKFDRCVDHWLDVSQRVFFKPSVTAHRCLNGRAPLYLSTTVSRPPVLTLGDSCVPATVNVLQ